MLVVLEGSETRRNLHQSQDELEPLSTRERMSSILDRVQKAGDQFVPFISLFDQKKAKPA